MDNTKIDITKYIKNKDVTINQEDINIEKLANDLRKGYELSSEVDKRIQSAVEDANKVSKGAYSELETKTNELQSRYDDIEKRNTDIVERNKTLSLENVMIRQGFKDEDFKDVMSMRYSMYADEKDDAKAISSIKEKFKNTYFPVVEQPKAKDSLPINSGSVEPPKPQVSRKTSIKDILSK